MQIVKISLFLGTKNEKLTIYILLKYLSAASLAYCILGVVLVVVLTNYIKEVFKFAASIISNPCLLKLQNTNSQCFVTINQTSSRRVDINSTLNILFLLTIHI